MRLRSGSRTAPWTPIDDDRRDLLKVAAAGGGLYVLPTGALVRRAWAAGSTDANAAPPALRFRQVHLDFHTSQQVEGIAADFDPDVFANTLARAHVNSVNCFARCHHGYVYYDTKKFPERRHPHLRRNLLKEQIDACHKRGIRAPIYLTVQWDVFSTEQHPEWRQVSAQGAFQGNPPYQPSFVRYLCVNTGYADFLKQHVTELFDLLPVDGLWIDIVKPQDCSCAVCREEMARRGIDAADEKARKIFGAEVTNRFKTEMSALIRRHDRRASIFYNSGHVGPYIRPTLDAYTHLELESLPSGGWGYLHFPLTARFARGLGQDFLGMTGKFHTSWGDFHSYKNRAALEFECFHMLALGGRCSIGDQMHPRGRLDPATYDLIGGVYAAVEKKEPWCDGARAVADIGVLSPEEGASDVEWTPKSSRGIVRILQEGGHQFDVVDSKSDLSRYRVVVLPDDLQMTPGLEAALAAFVKHGGGLLVSGKIAGLSPSFAAQILGVKVKGEAPFSPDYLKARPELARGLPPGELVMYLQGVDLVPQAGTQVLADTVEPYFNRTWDHFFSHRQTPSSGKIGAPAVVQKGRAITFAHPVCTQYATNAPLWVKRIFLNALDRLLPEPAVRTDGPSTLLAALNEQPAQRRQVLHLLHYIPERRGETFDVIEDVIPLHELKLSVRATQAPGGVRTVPEGVALPFTHRAGRIEFTLPKLSGHQMIEIALGQAAGA